MTGSPPRAVYLSADLLSQIEAHARSDAPYEACGLLFGVGAQVTAVERARNAADDPRHFFQLNARDLVRGVFAAERRGLTLIGFYHSHPEGSAVPSPVDLAQARYPDAVHLIVGLRSEPMVTAWRLSPGSAERLPLYIDAVPVVHAVANAQPRLGGAIVIAAALAVIMAITLALLLLPAPPDLPLP